MQPWLKLAALVLVVAALGLPVNDLFRYALLVIATVMIVAGAGAPRGPPRRAPRAGGARRLRGGTLFASPPPRPGRTRVSPFRTRARPRPRSRPAARGVPPDGRGVRHDISAGAAVRAHASGVLARTSLSRSNLRLFRRRHLRPRGVFAARHRHRFLRSGVAAPRVHQRT